MSTYDTIQDVSDFASITHKWPLPPVTRLWRTITAKIHGSNFNLLIEIFNFNTWILQLDSIFYTLPLAFTSLENVFTLVFWTQLFYLTLVDVHFKLDKQIFIHCFFLSVLMPEPVLYIWLRCQFCTRYSLAVFRQSWRQILKSTVDTKEAFVRVGDGDGSTSSPRSFVHHALWKMGVGRQHTTACSVKT